MAGTQGSVGIGQVPSLSEDDMKEGDLGDGMSASSVAGHRQGPVRALSRSKTDLVEPLSHLKLSKRASGEDSGAAFTWVPCSEMYRAFREDLEAEKGSRWRSRDSDSSSTDSSEVLQRRLQEATEEVELLRTELEVTHRHLEGKHEAVRILQGQAILDKATSHTKILLQKSEERNKALEKEVNALQWEITFNQVQFKNVEHEWGLRYDRVCAENKMLSKALDERLEQVQQLRTENTSLSQQCLELLGLLSAQDRNDFQKTRPPCCQGREGLSLEMAVYGACQCISNTGEPCPCAKSAAASRKQVLQLKQELELQKRMKDEAYVMMDAFRIAFEQQLRRGSHRVLQLAESDRQAPRRSKPSERVKQTSTSITQRLRMFLPFINDGKVLSEPMETLQLLLDLLSDKEEALAHQRKVSYMLARSSEDLERRLQAESDHSKNHTASEMDTREKVECDEDDCRDNGLSGTYSKKTDSTSEDKQRLMTDIPDGVMTESEN